MASLIQYHATVLGSPEPQAAARFYSNLLGWELGDDEQEWATVLDPAGGRQLSFQFEEGYERPVWPERPGKQQMMMHLDLLVTDLAKAAEHAEDCGAQRSPHQPQEDVMVLFDPDGHPFCLFEN
ncbi:VOC family protein [Sinomonas sp. ASV486]|uniref:VOC family protein n=1 Tax=Sinomonas sp. ASV486 TaxID=3051170 RepID=UPI0027DC3AC6|nr:VOC family protein [Sinomonas sp. ASV486]MDQ4490404.1 VOC family protein [Sinomonas sp. ASV486]